MYKIYSNWGLFSITFFFLFLTSISFSQTIDQDGEWGVPIPFDIVPVAVANLPDGRLLTWSSQFPNTFKEIGDGYTYTELFDPSANGGLGSALGMTLTDTDHDMFCPGINNLADGRILSAGGTTSERTSIYDPITNTWTRAADMNIPRGYQGNVTLSSGSVFTVGGSWSGGAGNNGGKAAELWSPESGWVNLPGITGENIYTANDLNLETQLNPLYRVDNHVWLWPAPNGKLFHAGPSEEMHWIDLDVPGGTITSAGFRSDDTYSMKGTTVMFDIGKILKVGGATSYGESFSSTTPAKNNAFVIDINVDYPQNPTIINAGYLSESRTMHNSTVLPNGQVLVTGGLDRGAVFTDTGARHIAELYTPASDGGAGTWETVAQMQEARTYHSVAILMTDGRVFVGGGGLCDNLLNGCNNHFSAEVYSPPYLFNSSGNLATRPIISDAPKTAAYDSNITVNASSGIIEFSLIRFSAATHSTNNEQRRIPVNFTGNGTYNIDIPNRNLLPPGYYMLFGIDTNGVPSKAATIKIGSALPLQIINENLIVDIKFEDAYGRNAVDSSMYHNDAAIIEHDDSGNGITSGSNYNWTSGIIGGAIEFNGFEHSSNALLDIQSSPSLQTLDEQITVMAWAYRNSTGGTSSPITGKLPNVGIFSHDYVSTLFFGFHNTMYKWAFVTNNGPVDLYAGRTPMDTWVHMAATYDGTTAKLYANGKLISWKELSGNIPFKDDGSLQSHFTSSGFFDERTAANLPTYANGSGITDEINGKIDELKVFNKVLGESEIREYYQQGINTGNPNVVTCATEIITTQYKIGINGNWQTKKSLIIEEGNDVYIRAITADNQYYITTPQENGPTFNSGGNTDYVYKIDTGVHAGGNPKRNNGLVDISNQGQFVMTTASGCTAVFDLQVIIVDETDGCSNYLRNDASFLTLPLGTIVGGADMVVGTSTVTNGSECALEISNIDNGQPWSGYRVSLNLNTLGINAGHELSVSIDAEGSTGVPRIEINQDNKVNTALLSHTFGSGWNTYSGTITVPANLTTLDIWLFTNYASQSPGTVYYDNLSIINLSDVVTNSAPISRPMASSITGPLPLTVDFNGGDSTDDTGIVSYSWDFGDGTTGTGIQPTHIYTSVGTFSAELTVTDDDGLMATEEIIITVEPITGSPVSLSSGTPLIGTIPLSVDFTGSGSSDDVGIISYAWDFGDGGTSAVPDPQYDYINAGNYTVTLTVTDDDGNSSVSTLDIEAIDGNVPLVCADQLTNDSAAITLPSGTLVGGSDTVVGTSTVTNGSECALEISNIDNGQPWGRYRVSLDLNGLGIDAGDELSISLDAEGSTGVPRIEINQDNRANSALLSHTYGSGWNTYSGTITVPANLTTLDIWLFTNYASQSPGTVYYDNLSIINLSDVVTNSAPISRPMASSITGPLPLTVDFNGGDSTDDTGIVSYSWDFGDGTTGTGIQPTHIYTSVGTFSAELTVTDDDGLMATEEIIITVEPITGSPVSLSSGTPLIGTIPLSVDFTGSGSSDDVGIISYAWDFGDGGTSAVPDPQYDYINAGNYTVTLTVTDDDGNSSVSTLDIEAIDGNVPLVCADQLTNDSAAITLPSGTLVGGSDTVVGTSTVTNGSECALEISNIDNGQPWGRYRVSLDLNGLGIDAGDELSISLDAEGSTGVPRIEINQDNRANSALLSHTYGSGWNTYSGTFTVPANLTTLDIWLFTNYASQNAGTVYYDNLRLEKINSATSKTLINTKSISFDLYPNPSFDIVTLNNKDEIQIKEIQFYDITGRLIRTVLPDGLQPSVNIIIDLYDFTEGFYIVNILDINGNRYQKELLIK
ncbi:MAG: PKD domain-containing protein [Maribacter sp.]|nr:PKD domain-containing protein [Maribacter sp.]